MSYSDSLWGRQSYLQPPFQAALSGHARVFAPAPGRPLRDRKGLISLGEERVQGDPRGPGGPPYLLCTTISPRRQRFLQPACTGSPAPPACWPIVEPR
jgi:hypothetical protein